MTERGTIGSILMSAGRITEEDVGKALAHQRDQGGYFGAALLACGLVSEGELEWGLASQYDLPYVFPDADSVDYEAAMVVSPEWALTHLTLPIMKTADTLTVIVESPIKTKAVDDLRSRTDLEIQLALAAPSKIRELIREVYARAAAADESGYRAPVELSEAWDEVLLAGAPRFGISARGKRAAVWWDDGGTVRRMRLAGDWQQELEETLTPGPDTAVGEEGRATWEGTLTRAGTVTPVDVRFLRDESGLEYLFHPRQQPSEVQTRFPLPTPGIVSEVRLLARSGKARFVTTSAPASLGPDILPHLPELLLDPSWRCIYINAADRPAAEEAFSHRLSDDPASWATELETLRAFQFDAVTVDLSGGASDWPSSALDVASVAFLLWDASDDVRPAYEAGIRWHLHIAEQDDGDLEWTLEPLPA
jgi:type IV pilus assembly protein PilB